LAASRKKAHPRGPGLGTGTERDGCRLSGRLWVEKDGQTFLAWGRIVLLERIRELGSINKAAKSMGMGYRHAWALVEEMNRLSPKPLIQKTTGGRGGGGTVLTPEGESVIASFWELVEDFKTWLASRDPRLWRAGHEGRHAGKGRRS
jgi:molybdate transport system regulatory protein